MLHIWHVISRWQAQSIGLWTGHEIRIREDMTFVYLIEMFMTFHYAVSRMESACTSVAGALLFQYVCDPSKVHLPDPARINT